MGQCVCACVFWQASVFVQQDDENSIFGWVQNRLGLKCFDVPHVQSLRARTAGDVTTFYRVFLSRKVVEAQTYTLGMLH